MTIVSALMVCIAAYSFLTPAQAKTNVTGTVFNDLNGDGAQGLTEPGIQGARVSDGTVSALTNASGNFVLPVSAFPATVSVTVPTNMLPTTPSRQKITSVTQLPVQFGLKKIVTKINITGTVFYDLNGDGAQGLTEPGIQGATVSDGFTWMTTDPSGIFIMPTLTLPRNVSLTVPANMVPTTASNQTVSNTNQLPVQFGLRKK